MNKTPTSTAQALSAKTTPASTSKSSSSSPTKSKVEKPSVSPKKDLKTPSHNVEKSKPKTLPVNSPDILAHTQLIRTSESQITDQAIDVDMPPGITNARFIKNLMTPSGMKPVIIMADEEFIEPIKYDFLPGLDMPESGHVWSHQLTSIPVSGNPTVTMSPKFSERTKYYLRPYMYFNGHALVRLICKPGLMQSQNYWVSRSFDLLSTSGNRHLNEIGFNWNPSKQNEIFVLLPYAAYTLCTPISSANADTFGYLIIRPVSSLVSSDGSDIPLQINYYFAPYKFKQYVPTPVSTLVEPNSTSFALIAQGVTVPIATTSLGTLTLAEESYVTIDNFLETEASFFSLQCDTTQFFENNSITGTSSLLQSGALIPAGVYSLNAVVTQTAYDCESQINLVIIYTDKAPLFRATPITNFEEQMEVFEINRVAHSTTTRTKEIKCGNTTMTIFTDHLPNEVKHYSCSNLINVHHSYSKEGKIFKYVIVSSFGGRFEINCFVNDFLLAKICGYNKKVMKQNFCDTIMHLCNPYDIMLEDIVFEEQIFEYSYNPISKAPSEYYGQMYSSNPRENHHLNFLQEIQLTSANKSAPYNFTLDLSVVATSYPYISTREYLRSYLKSHYPIVTIRSNKTPVSNVLLRVVQGTYTTSENIMQLPGKEWDPTSTDLAFQPYWDNVNPVQRQITLNFSVIVLSGQIDNDGMSLLVYFNTSPIMYHGKIDYNITQTNSNNVVLRKMNKDLKKQGFCLKCYCDPCSCNIVRSKPSTSVFIEQLGGDDTTALESALTCDEPIETESETKINEVTLMTEPTTIAPDSGKVMREKAYNYVGHANIDLFDGTNPLIGVAIPLSHINFGKEELTSAYRYRRWRGVPRFRVTLACSSQVSGVAYASHIAPSFDLTSFTADDGVRMFAHSQNSLWNSSVEIETPWFNEQPYNPVTYTLDGTLPVPQIGYLFITFPTLTRISLTGLDNALKLVLECDMADIQYDMPSYAAGSDWSYPGFTFNTIYSS